MSRILALSSLPVKRYRKTPRPAAPFGAGILASVPHYRVPFTADDAQWAAESFNYEPEPDYERLAGEAAYFVACEVCGLGFPADELDRGMCLACDGAAEASTMSSLYLAAGMGRQTN